MQCRGRFGKLRSLVICHWSFQPCAFFTERFIGSPVVSSSGFHLFLINCALSASMLKQFRIFELSGPLSKNHITTCELPAMLPPSGLNKILLFVRRGAGCCLRRRLDALVIEI